MCQLGLLVDLSYFVVLLLAVQYWIGVSCGDDAVEATFLLVKESLLIVDFVLGFDRGMRFLVSFD